MGISSEPQTFPGLGDESSAVVYIAKFEKGGARQAGGRQQTGGGLALQAQRLHPLTLEAKQFDPARRTPERHIMAGRESPDILTCFAPLNQRSLNLRASVLECGG